MKAKTWLKMRYVDQLTHANLDFLSEMLEEYAKDELTDYTEFLLKHNYCDSDVYDELPSAIDRYMHPKLR